MKKIKSLKLNTDFHSQVGCILTSYSVDLGFKSRPFVELT
jgi:hypothetical protein